MSTQALSVPISSLSLLLVHTQVGRWKAATPDQLTGAHLYLDIAYVRLPLSCSWECYGTNAGISSVGPLVKIDKYYWKFKHLHLRKCVWKCRLPNADNVSRGRWVNGPAKRWCDVSFLLTWRCLWTSCWVIWYAMRVMLLRRNGLPEPH